jgi:hypothetical protein
MLDYLIDEIDLVLVMSVNPGLRRAELHRQPAAQDRGGAQDDRQERAARSASRSTAGSTARPRASASTPGADVLVAGSATFAGGPDRYAANYRRTERARMTELVTRNRFVTGAAEAADESRKEPPRWRFRSAIRAANLTSPRGARLPVS